jgi:hypothetical protein
MVIRFNPTPMKFLLLAIVNMLHILIMIISFGRTYYDCDYSAEFTTSKILYYNKVCNCWLTIKYAGINIYIHTVWQWLFIAIKPKHQHIFHTTVILFLHRLQNIITITKTVYFLKTYYHIKILHKWH